MRKLLLYTLYALSYMLGGLFIYTAAKKYKDFVSYAAHIEASELFAKEVSWWVAPGVIGIEIIFALVLVVPMARVAIWAWKAVPVLMAVYSYYIYYILHKAPFKPCACKAVYEELGWMGHLYLNIGITVLALVVLVIYYYRWIRKSIQFIFIKIKNIIP